MSNPWDRPPLATRGDDHESKTFEAVGHVMTGWEQVEMELACLYAAFLGVQPLAAIAMPEYVKARVFWQRRDVVLEAAACYFQRYCSQELEGKRDGVMAAVNGFADRRNDVAHGIVTANFDQTNSLLGPASYRHKEFDPLNRTPDFLYSSVELEQFCEGFRTVRRDLRTLTLAILVQNASRHRSSLLSAG